MVLKASESSCINRLHYGHQMAMMSILIAYYLNPILQT